MLNDTKDQPEVMVTPTQISADRLTVAQKRKYLLEDPDSCPFCGSSNIKGGEFDLEIYFRPVSCQDCGEEWEEQFKMTNVVADVAMEGCQCDQCESILTQTEYNKGQGLCSDCINSIQ